MGAAQEAFNDELSKVLKYLDSEKKEQLLNFAGYLASMDEWKATYEVREDEALLKSVRSGLIDIQNGDVEAVEL